MAAQQGGQRVDGPQPVSVHLLTRAGQDLQRRLQLAGPSISQTIHLHDERRTCGGERVQRVSLAGAAQSLDRKGGRRSSCRGSPVAAVMVVMMRPVTVEVAARW